MPKIKVPVAVRFHKLISSRRTTTVQPDGANTQLFTRSDLQINTTFSMDEILVLDIFFCNMGTDASRN